MMRSRLRAPVVASVAFLLVGAACTPSVETPVVPEPAKHVADVHRAKCGNCHVRVEPGTRSHAALESAFSRHKKRVHLSEDEWNELIEYLAQSPEG
jgi:hypothetical protein